MVVKIALCLIGLLYVTFMPAKSYIENVDKNYAESFFMIMASYTVITSSLYFISYPMGEKMNEIPVRMAYILLRILVSFFLVACYHLKDGLVLEFDEIDSDMESQKLNGIERYQFRAIRIICILSLIVFVVFMALTLIQLCYISGIDGSRVYRPKAFKKFRKITFGNLIFQ